MPQPAPVDPDRVTEQHQGEDRRGQVADELVGRVGLDQVQDPTAVQVAEVTNTMAWLTGVDRSRPDTAP